MRVIVVAAMVLGFAVSPALARPAGAGDKAATTAAATSGASAANTPSESATASKSDSPAKPAESNMESELQELRDLIEAQSKQIQVQSEALKEQQQQMQALEKQLKISSSAPANASIAAAPAPLFAVIARDDSECDFQCSGGLELSRGRAKARRRRAAVAALQGHYNHARRFHGGRNGVAPASPGCGHQHA